MKVSIMITNSLKLFPITNNTSLVQLMACRWTNLKKKIADFYAYMRHSASNS